MINFTDYLTLLGALGYTHRVMIAKHLIKIFSNKDPRRQLYKEEVANVEKELQGLIDKPAWVTKHAVGVDAVLTLSIFWAIVIGPIETAPEASQTKDEKKLLKRFYGFLKTADITHGTVQLPLGTPIGVRLAAMSYLDTDSKK